MAVHFLSRDQVRELDRRAEVDGLPTRVLMESAGRGAAEVLVSLGVHGPIVVCHGKGNNGGDGQVMARWLARWGACVHVFDLAALAADSSTPLPDRLEFLAAEVGRAEWVVDALFGIGLSAPPRSPYDQFISLINGSAARIFALDLPSGLDADTGEPLGSTIRAKHTATFVALKKGFANPASTTWTGRVHVVELGIASIRE